MHRRTCGAKRGAEGLTRGKVEGAVVRTGGARWRLAGASRWREMEGTKAARRALCALALSEVVHVEKDERLRQHLQQPLLNDSHL